MTKQHPNLMHCSNHAEISKGAVRCNLNPRSASFCLNKHAQIVRFNVHLSIQTDWFGYGQMVRDCSISPLKKAHFRADSDPPFVKPLF
jgi:hypothetical protein